MPASPTAEDLLIKQIREAFADVTLGAGIGLWQARAIDDYASDLEQRLARKRDELSDWSRIPSADLLHCDSSLSFVDAEGMCFLLPAFMIDFIRRKVAVQGQIDAVMYTLTTMTDYGRSRFTILDARQRAAVVAFLRWNLKDEEAYWGPGVGSRGERIVTALREYWMAE